MFTNVTRIVSNTTYPVYIRQAFRDTTKNISNFVFDKTSRVLSMNANKIIRNITKKTNLL